MDSSLRLFVHQLTGAIALALLPVVLVAFCSIPFNLGGHPGEERPIDMATQRHMT